MIDNIIEIEKTGLGPRDAEDLRWFFCDAPGVVLSSSFGKSLEQAQFNIPRRFRMAGDDGMTDQLIEHMTRYRRIGEKLTAAGRRSSLVLSKHYGPDTPKMLGAFKRYAPLAAMAPSAILATEGGVRGRAVLMASLAGLSARALASSGDTRVADKLLVRVISRECETLYLGACEAYKRASRAKQAA